MQKGCYNCKHDTEGTLPTGHPCETCLSTHGKDVPPTNWEAAENYKPSTNADRIRAMTDEELAAILNAFSAYFDECNRSSSVVDCNDCELNELCSLREGEALKWLRQPVTED